MIVAWTAVALLLTLTPGADTALVLRTSVRSGWAAGVRCTLGICTGTMTWAALSALGVSALVSASPLAYDLLRYGGAAYLLLLGVQALRTHAGPPESAAPVRAFRDGLVTNLLNPKIGVFYATVLPGFVPSGRPVLATSLLLAGIHAALGLAWLAVVARGADRLAVVLRRDAWRQRLERVTGAVLIAFGVKILVRA